MSSLNVEFIGSKEFSGRAGELRYEKTGGTTLVEADIDGNGVTDFAISLQGAIALNASDFML